MNALAVADFPVLTDETSLIKRFLAWTLHAFPHERAAAVNALARAYLHCGLSRDARLDAEIALTRALDDAEPMVRRALAEAFADAREAPRAIVLALASDVSHVSRPVLARSPLLRDADLVDCAAIGDARAQTAIARRARLTGTVAAALAEIGERPAALALIDNRDAEIGKPALWRLFERFQGDAEARARLVGRPNLPAALRAALAAAATAEMAEGDWLDPRRAERIARDGREQAFVSIAADCADEERPELVAWLRASGRLTVGLLLRALCSGDAGLFADSLADMSGLSRARVAGPVRDPRSQAFAALYARAKMPAHLIAAFRIVALRALEAGRGGIGINYALTLKALKDIEAENDPALAPVVALLWRLASEGARAEARDYAAAALAPEAIEAETAPLQIEAAAPPVLMLNVAPGNENFAPPVTLDLDQPVLEAVAA